MKKTVLGTMLLISLCMTVQAASDSWNVDANGAWTNVLNWASGTNAPGAETNTIFTDTATFSLAPTATNLTVTVGDRSVAAVAFGNASTNGYTIKGTRIRLSAGGVIETLPGTGAHNDTIDAGIQTRANSNITVTIRNNSKDAGLIISGAMTGLGSAGTHTIILDGTNTASAIGGKPVNLISGAIGESATAPKNVVKNGTGTWCLNANNTYSGGTTVNQGTLRYYSSSSVFGTGRLTIGDGVTLNHANSTPINISNKVSVTGNFRVGGGTSNTTWSGDMDLGAAVRTLTVDSALTIAGTVTNGGLTQAGTNTLTLSGTNTYGGATTVSNGILAINGDMSAAAGAVTVGAGATLRGIGIIGGATTVNAGGSLAAGNTVGGTNVPGILTFNDAVLLSAGSTNIMDVYTNGVGVLKGNGTNTLTMNGETIFDFTGNTVTTGSTFHVLQNWGSISTSGTFVAVGLDTNLSLDTSALASSGYLTVVSAAPSSNTLTGSAGANGSVTPGTTNVVSGNNADFTVTADLYYRIASLTTNGTAVTGMTFDNSSTVTNFTWSNVQSTGTVAATFTAQLATDPAGTPYAWLAGYGLTNYDADAVADQDGDGLKTWQEYIAGTDPTNAASCLKVAQTNRNTVTWSAVPDRVYSVYWSTNLVHGFTNLASGIQYPQGSYTNTTPDAKVNHYQVKVQLQ